jgi:hypothetical protein
LEQILKKEKTLKEQEIKKIAKKVLESLKVFEENLIVYGNLSCRNILVTEEKLYFSKKEFLICLASLLYSVVLNSKGDKIFSDQGNPCFLILSQTSQTTWHLKSLLAKVVMTIVQIFGVLE